jgi:hypothetical protein
MKTVSKVAILNHSDSNLTFEFDEIIEGFRKINIEARLFQESDSIIEFQPDCVIVTSPQHAKLTPFPTYGFINKPRDEYLSIPRFLRNMLTYDGYFTISPRLNLMLRDVMFGARKLGTKIEKLDFYPNATEFKEPVISTANPPIIIFEPDVANSKFQNAIEYLLDKNENISVVTFASKHKSKYAKRYIAVKNNVELISVLNQYAIAICLCSGDEMEETLNATIMKLIASSTIVIAHQTKHLEKCFGENLYYIPQSAQINKLSDVVQAHIKDILNKPSLALIKSRQAHQIFVESFAFDKQLPTLLKLHESALIDKGYVPHPDPKIETSLPSASYIMRTGGKNRPFLERALDCLIAQQYPDLRVIFVIHAHFDYIDEIIAKYPSLKIKVIESIKSRRSEAIRDGMAAVETDLFGLFDDDDELFPNHVRSLVKTLQYHTRRDWRGEIGMVYSGSIHVDDTLVVDERPEFRDHRLIRTKEKRAMEHFRFYSSVLMSQHAWFMPNGWLARTSLIDEELLVDPELDTCEDLYFELQIAQKAQLAFSLEVTMVHNFHHFGNSTIDDSYKHFPDTQRIALRNFTRVFPTDSLYDTQPYTIVGKLSGHDPNQIGYQTHFPADHLKEYYYNQFFPFRSQSQAINLNNDIVNEKLKLKFILLPHRVMKFFVDFKQLSPTMKEYYVQKFRLWLKQYGFFSAVKKTILFVFKKKVLR